MKLIPPLLLGISCSEGFIPRAGFAAGIKGGVADSSNNSELDTCSTNQKWDVDRYQKGHSFVFEYGSSLIDLLDPHPGERILDVGCGSGELSHQISERGAIVVGIDADSNMIQRAQNSFPETKFFQADVRSFQQTLEQNGSIFEPELMDAIFSNAALHWVKDAEQAVASMSRALKSGGRFVVEFGAKGNVQKIVSASLEALGKDDNNKNNPWYFPSIAEYSSILERHRIEVISATIFDRPTLLEEGEDGMANWLRMFGGTLLGSFSEEQSEQIIQEIVEKLRPQLFDGKRWTADYRRIRMVGRKL